MFCEKCGHQIAEKDKFCETCGNALFPNNATPVISIEDKKKYKKRALVWFLIPVISFLGIVIIWGIINFIFQSKDVPDIVVFINSILIPFVIGLLFLFTPISIVSGIYYYLKSKR
jgi:uncharacterized membrane protein YvbJ